MEKKHIEDFGSNTKRDEHGFATFSSVSHNLNALVGRRRWRCGLCGLWWYWTLRWSIALAALAQDVRGTSDGLVARHFIFHLDISRHPC